jgi:DNA polymerase-3 subunit delta
MILKTFDLEKLNFNKYKIFLLYGENQGFKTEVIENIFKKKIEGTNYCYEENEVLNNQENFFNNILSKSFFENKKLIIVTRVSEKSKNIIEEIIERKIKDITLVLNANILEKNSKIRIFFEKNKNTVCVPFYRDNNQTLAGMVNHFFRNSKIQISQQAINLIVDRCRGDRQNLNNELKKIESFIINKKNINIEDLVKLTNLAENFTVSELIDNCLAKNKKKTINILNENNYLLEDCILILRTLLLKSKRLLQLCLENKNIKNIDSVISSFKPPIFWKDKIIVKQQVENWSYNNVENLIYKINEIELLIKKNSNNSINILSNFIIEQTTTVANN